MVYYCRGHKTWERRCGGGRKLLNLARVFLNFLTQPENMPIYVLVCPKCGEKFEAKRNITSDEPLPCPKCGVPGEIIIQPSAIKLGWITPPKNRDPFKPLAPEKYRYPSEFRKGKLY